jgi:TP901 family phage tail tape measure protein
VAKGQSHIILKIGGQVLGSLNKSIKQANASVRGMSTTVSRNLNDGFAAGQQGMMNVVNNPAWRAAAVASTGIGLAMVDTMKVVAGFEQTMDAVFAKVGDSTAAQQASLTNLAKELGRTTKYTAQESAAAMEFLAQAGYKTNQILDATPGLLDLATVGKLELAEAADIASNVLGGFGMQASETSKVVDLLSKASVSGNVDVTMLGEAFAKAGPPFKNAGQSIESLAASLDILGNAGVQGSEAGTHLRAMMLRMASGQADGALNELGVSVKDANGQMKPMADLLAEIDKAMRDQNITGQAQLAMQKDLFGMRAATTGMILQEKAATGELQKQIELLADSEGHASKTAKKMNDNLAGAFKRLQSAWEGLQHSMGGDLTGILTKLTDGLAKVVGGVAWLFEKIPGLGEAVFLLSGAFAALTAALPFIFYSVGLWNAGLGTMVGKMKLASLWASISSVKFTAMWAAATGPIGLAIAGIAAVVAGVVLLWKKCDWFRNGITQIFNSIFGIFRGAWNMVKGFFQLIGGLVTGNTKLIDTALSNLWKGFQGFFGNILGAVLRIAKFIILLPFQIVGTIIKTVIWGIQNLFKLVFNLVKGSLYLLYKLVVNIFGLGWIHKAVILPLWNGLKNGIPKLISGVGNLLTGLLKGLGTLILNIILAPFRGLKALLGKVIVPAFKAIPNLIGGALKGIGSGIVNIATAPLRGMGAILKGVVMPGLSWLWNLGQPIRDGLMRGLTGAAQALSNFTSTIGSWFSNLGSNALQAGADFVNAIKDGILGAAQNLWNAVTGVFGKIRNMLPFSDAKEGPLADLTASGKMMMDTLGKGIQLAKDGDILGGVRQALGGIAGAISNFLLPNPQGSAQGQAATPQGAPAPALGSTEQNQKAPAPEPSFLNLGGLLNPTNVPAPVSLDGLIPAAQPQPALATAGASMGGQNITATFNINGSSSDAQAIAEQVRTVFNDIVEEAQAGARSFLND